MERPRLLLLPEFTELEWTIVPQLTEWAEVATYDAPGVGAEEVSPEELERLADDVKHRRARVAQRGVEEISRRGWQSCVLVSDSAGNLAACRLAAEHPELVEGIALGHGCLSLDRDGKRAPINREIASAMDQLVGQDREQFVRHALTQLTGGSYDERMAEEMTERVPLTLLTRTWLQGGDDPASDLLEGLDIPLLLVKHEGCLMYTEEGFEDATAAFPEAETASVPDKPSVSAEFAEILRGFCEKIPPAP